MPFVQSSARMLAVVSRQGLCLVAFGALWSSLVACSSGDHPSDDRKKPDAAAGVDAGGSGEGEPEPPDAIAGGAGGVGPAEIVAPTAALTNLRARGVVHTGFLSGTALAGTQGLASVDVSLDDGPFEAATGGANWMFQLPTGAQTWRDGTLHTIAVRATDATGMSGETSRVSVRQGVNRDVNGDGYEDLALRNSYNSGHGEADVFLSTGAAGVQSADIADAATIITSTSKSFGWGVALGDINGDGYADIVVGANEVNADELNTFAGAAYVFHSAGPQGIPSGDDTAADAVLSGTEQGRLFGESVAVADVNGDGYGDIAVGAGSKGGGVYVFHSAGDSGLATATVADADASLEDSLGNFGWAVAAGDLNGDGYADVVAGNPNSGSGVVRILYSTGEDGIPLDTHTVLIGTATRSGFGGALAIGDVNGDGYADLGVAAIGKAFFFYSTGKAGVVEADDSGANVTLAGAIEDGYLAIAAGDINGDGFSDVVLGDKDAGSKLGQTEVFYSAGSKGIASAQASEADAILVGTLDGDAFGFGVAVTDLDGDGYADVVAGAGRLTFEAAGYVYVFPSAGQAGISNGDDTNAAARLTSPAGDFGSLFVRADESRKINEDPTAQG